MFGEAAKEHDMPAKKKVKPLRPRPLKAWAIMNIKGRTICQVYTGGYNKTYVLGDCMDGQTVVRVRIMPDK